MTRFPKLVRRISAGLVVAFLNAPFFIQAAPVTTNYSYNSAGFLASVTRNGTSIASYIYDANGNITSAVTPAGSTSYTYDARDRLLTAGATSFSYTDAGEVKTRVAPNGTTSYTYDELGQLRHVSLPDGRNIDYVLGTPAMRIAKKINGAVVQGFLRGPEGNIVAELDGSNAVTSRFVYSQVSETPAYMIRGSDTFQLVTDSLGSVRLVVNAQTGATVQRIDYDEWGRVTQDSNPGFQPFGFAGGIYDKDTGLVRFGARDYDPSVARWTAPDPLNFGGRSTNLYTYVGNDPLNQIDPSGTGPRGQYILRHSEYSNGVTVRHPGHPEKHEEESPKERYHPLEIAQETGTHLFFEGIGSLQGVPNVAPVLGVIGVTGALSDAGGIVVNELTGNALDKAQDAAKKAGNLRNPNVPVFDPYGYGTTK